MSAGGAFAYVCAQDLAAGQTGLVEVAQSGKQWTGVAVSHAGRIFVCYPRWSDDVQMSVAELVPVSSWSTKLQAVAYPGGAWQGYKEGGDAANSFVCVQSVVVDDADNRLDIGFGGCRRWRDSGGAWGEVVEGGFEIETL